MAIFIWFPLNHCYIIFGDYYGFHSCFVWRILIMIDLGEDCVALVSLFYLFPQILFKNTWELIIINASKFIERKITCMHRTMNLTVQYFENLFFFLVQYLLWCLSHRWGSINLLKIESYYIGAVYLDMRRKEKMNVAYQRNVKGEFV